MSPAQVSFTVTLQFLEPQVVRLTHRAAARRNRVTSRMVSLTSDQIPATPTTWHALDVSAVLDRLGTDPATGLASAQASQPLEQYGPNRLPEGKRRGPFMRFLSQLNNVLVYVLLSAGFGHRL